MLFFNAFAPSGTLVTVVAGSDQARSSLPSSSSRALPLLRAFYRLHTMRRVEKPKATAVSRKPTSLPSKNRAFLQSLQPPPPGHQTTALGRGRGRAAGPAPCSPPRNPIYAQRRPAVWPVPASNDVLPGSSDFEDDDSDSVPMMLNPGRCMPDPDSPTPAPRQKKTRTTELLERTKETTDEWYKSRRTKNGYAGYVKAGKKWIVEWARERDSGDEDIMASELGVAFEELNEHTPTALRLFTAWKCEEGNCKFPTAEGIRSAFKDYFERVMGCQGDFWKFNPYLRRWEGNPVCEREYNTYFDSLKNRGRRTETTTQSLPMLPKDLKIIMDYLDSNDGKKHFAETRRLYFKAFSSTAITLWTRNDELINLQRKHLNLGLESENGQKYLEAFLIFRKTNNDPTKGQKYQVPQDSSMPEIDCYTHLLAWTEHLEKVMGRPLMDNDYIFPAIASTGKLKIGQATSRSAIEQMIDKVVEGSGVLNGRNGKFTTHCFRRGGAQYRFMWAPRKWSLKAVKWWGGWSSNENVGTITRYLLDELMAYEEGYGDMLMTNRMADRESFMGESPGTEVPVSRADLQSFGLSLASSIEQRVSLMLAETFKSPAMPAFPSTPQRAFVVSQHTPLTAPPTPTSTVPTTTQNPVTATPTSLALQSGTTLPSPLVQRQRIPECRSLTDVIQFWTTGCPEKGLQTPLSQWASTFSKSDYKSEAVKLGNIGMIFTEYQVRYNGSDDEFDRAYPQLRHKFTKLLHAVRAARQARGEAKTRRRVRSP